MAQVVFSHESLSRCSLRPILTTVYTYGVKVVTGVLQPHLWNTQLRDITAKDVIAYEAGTNSGHYDNPTMRGGSAAAGGIPLLSER
ncbi:hypothetical protein TNCV_2173971 [Trichonephila clavipes]|nr:hypothetical protein TNCV_2173971 [Trichonephila clavipes]